MTAITPPPQRRHGVLAIEPGVRGGRPVIRGMRITAGDVPGWLALGMSHAKILKDFPELTEAGIRAVLASAARRERVAVKAAQQGGAERPPGRATASRVQVARS